MSVAREVERSDKDGRLRVFQLIKSLGRGGAEMLLPATYRHADRGRFVYRYAYFLPWKSAMVPDLEAQGVDVTCLSKSSAASILLSAGQVARELKAWRADVLHCHLPMAGIVGRIAGRLAGVPVVYTEHNVLERYHPLTRRASLLTWKLQAEVVAVSADVAESLRRGAPAGVPVNVVLNGVDVDHFDRKDDIGVDVRASLGIPTRAPVVGTVAVFRVQKRLDEWLRVARALLDHEPDTHFLMVGDGPLREELERTAVALGLDAAVHWVGLQEDVRPYLGAMDVYMMSSLFEGLPIALLEAMAMRCAVVCTAAGGIPEAVRHGQNGLLVDVEHPERLTECVLEVFRSPSLSRCLGDAARATVEDEFSVRRMAREVEETYERVIDGYHGV